MGWRLGARLRATHCHMGITEPLLHQFPTEWPLVWQCERIGPRGLDLIGRKEICEGTRLWRGPPGGLARAPAPLLWLAALGLRVWEGVTELGAGGWVLQGPPL